MDTDEVRPGSAYILGLGVRARISVRFRFRVNKRVLNTAWLLSGRPLCLRGGVWCAVSQERCNFQTPHFAFCRRVARPPRSPSATRALRAAAPSASPATPARGTSPSASSEGVSCLCSGAGPTQEDLLDARSASVVGAAGRQMYGLHYLMFSIGIAPRLQLEVSQHNVHGSVQSVARRWRDAAAEVADPDQSGEVNPRAQSS